MKTFLSALVATLDIDSGNTRVGLVTYATNVFTSEGFKLNTYSTVADVQGAISELTYSGGSTYTAAALYHVRDKMLITAAGDRLDVPNVVVLLSGGKSDVNVTQTSVSTV